LDRLELDVDDEDEEDDWDEAGDVVVIDPFLLVLCVVFGDKRVGDTDDDEDEFIGEFDASELLSDLNVSEEDEEVDKEPLLLGVAATKPSDSV